MKPIRNFLLTMALLSCSCVAGWSQASTPEAALAEMATATKIEDVEKHLPVKLHDALEALSPKEKTEFRKEFLISERLGREGVKLLKTDDGRSWDVVAADGDRKGSISVKNSFMSGSDALVLLQAKEKESDKSHTFVVSMRLEEGEWRVTGAGGFQEMDFESEEFLSQFRRNSGHEDSQAAAFLRTLNTCMIAYASAYPTVGFPASLNALSSGENSEPSPEHAMLIGPLSVTGPLVKDGFEFHYNLIDPGNVEGHQGKYRITATPVEFGKTGTRSFFTDETAVIRFTTEDREANENDPPL